MGWNSETDREIPAPNAELVGQQALPGSLRLGCGVAENRQELLLCPTRPMTPPSSSDPARTLARRCEVLIIGT